jgi:putative flippase GtrA
VTQQRSHPPLKHVWQTDAPLTTRLALVVRHPSSLKLVKYASVSIISTVVAQVTLFLVFGVFHLVPAVAANIIANIVATPPSYYLNRRWVWGKGGKSHLWREIVPFWVLSFVGLALSSLTVYGAEQFAKHHNLSHAWTTLLVNAANLFAFALLWMIKFVIYQRLFHVEPIEHPEDESDLVEA